MAVRVRADGRMLCAAMHPAEEGDTYIDDNLHYEMSVEHRVLVTDKEHHVHGEWWWVGSVPKEIEINKWWSD